MGIMRKTPSIELLLGQFNNHTNAMSVVALVKLLQHKINKTTIYRVLNKLEDDGVLHSFIDKNGLRWYAKCQCSSKLLYEYVNPHFQCTSCGEVQCIPTQVKLPELPDYTISNTHIMLEGICKSCRS